MSNSNLTPEQKKKFDESCAMGGLVYQTLLHFIEEASKVSSISEVGVVSVVWEALTGCLLVHGVDPAKLRVTIMEVADDLEEEGKIQRGDDPNQGLLWND